MYPRYLFKMFDNKYNVTVYIHHCFASRYFYIHSNKLEVVEHSNKSSSFYPLSLSIIAIYTFNNLSYQIDICIPKKYFFELSKDCLNANIENSGNYSHQII